MFSTDSKFDECFKHVVVECKFVENPCSTTAFLRYAQTESADKLFFSNSTYSVCVYNHCRTRQEATSLKKGNENQIRRVRRTTQWWQSQDAELEKEISHFHFRATAFTYAENVVWSYFNVVNVSTAEVIGAPARRRLSVSGEVIEVYFFQKLFNMSIVIGKWWHLHVCVSE